MTLKLSTEPDKRTLKQILDSINEVAVQLPYLQCRDIQEDIAEIWRRYGSGYGEWIHICDDVYDFYKCSVCKHVVEAPGGVPEESFCPNCGSAMFANTKGVPNAKSGI